MDRADRDTIEKILLNASDRLALSLLASQPNPTVGLSRKEVDEYSLVSLLRGMRGLEERGLEGEAHAATLERLAPEVRNEIPDGYSVVPPEVLSRALASNPGTAGGYLVGSGVGGFVDVLRARSVAFRLGAQSLPNLRRSMTFGRVVGDVTVHWQAGDGTSVAASDSVLGQMSLTPHSAVAITEVSEQFLGQGGATVESFLFSTLAGAVASAVDGATINGAGGAQPLGIKNTTGVTTGQDAAGATDVKLDAFVQAVGGANALTERAGWISNTAGGIALTQRHIVAATYSPLWSGSVIDGRVRGFPATTSEHLASANLIFGSWDELVVADWGTLAIALDRSDARFNTAQVGIRALWLTDIMLLRPQSFVVGTNLS